jgi:hypothetical protein
LSLGGRSQPPLSNALVAVALGLLGNDGDAAFAGSRLVRSLIEHDVIGSEAVTQAMRWLLASPAVSPAKLTRPLEAEIELLPTLWPTLTEPVRVAGNVIGSLPRCLNRVLDVIAHHAPHLAEATRRGLIPGWPGLADIAARPGKSAAVAKAQALVPLLF